MINPSIIQLNRKSQKNGLYESYYYRGNHEDGNSAFWLKHNLLMFAGDCNVRVQSTLITFDKNKDHSETFNHMEVISLDEYLDRFSENKKSWNEFEYEFRNGSKMKVSSEVLKGELILPKEEKISWNLSLKPSNETYYHFSNNWFYHGFFPKKKILTKDISLKFTGQLSVPRGDMEGTFLGINGHNWGKEHAYKYAYGNCNQFQEDSDAYFDGFSAKISLAKGLIKSPYLSGASLKFGGQWYHFNNVLTSYKHCVQNLLEKKWQITFVNKDYLLEANIIGNDEIWAHLNYDHPSGKVSTVHNTKFAKGTLILKSQKDKEIIKVLRSNFFELESLIP